MRIREIRSTDITGVDEAVAEGKGTLRTRRGRSGLMFDGLNDAA